jgi:hypothetical protein
MAKLPPRLRGKSTKARLGRLNRRIKGVNKRYNEGGDVSPGGKPPGIDKLRARRSVLQDKLAKEQKQNRQRRDNALLSDPTAVLSGKNMWSAARALEKAQSLPMINSKRNLIAQTQKSTDRDIAKLSSMGGRLDNQLKGLSSSMDQYGAEALTRAKAANTDLSQRLTANADQAQNRLNSLQGSVLGEQISALRGQGVDPSRSSSAQTMGQFAEMQQQSQANRSKATNDLAAAMAQANLMTTEAGTTAAKNTLNNQAIAVQRNIASRSADRMFQGSQDVQTARSELATLKGLRGAELINQVMKLRGGEREFISAKEANATERFIANTQANQSRIDAATDRFNAETKRMDVNNDSSGGGSGGSSGDGSDLRLNKPEFRQARAAADEILSDPRNGGKVTNWTVFLDKVQKAEGVSWTPVERKQFKRRYKKYLARKG